MGIVTEGDLLHRDELGDADNLTSWWVKVLGPDNSAADFVKTGLAASVVMAITTIVALEFL